MVLPPDLASLLTALATSQGRTPEAFLRETLRRMGEPSISLAPQPVGVAITLEDTAHIRSRFVPQQFGVSIYE